MVGPGLSDSEGVPGVVVSVCGAVLAGTHLLHGLAEIDEGPLAVVYGVALPLLVSVFVVWSGYWVATREWDGEDAWCAPKWLAAGLGVGVVLTALFTQYQAAHGVDLEDDVFVFVIYATYGGALGLLFARYDRRIRTARRDLKRESHRLDEFASLVSHDLRNPLNVAQGRVELARETGDLTHLEAVEDAHDRMETIIRDTLTLARQGEDAVSLEHVDLPVAATRARDMLDGANVDLRVEAERPVRADPDRLRTLFENLLRNAVEHNDGPVTVTVGDLPGGFYVEDDGQGIPRERREEVFESGVSTAEGGTGLGLAIVRAAAEAHGWSVNLTGSESGGARFEFTGVETVE